MKGETSKVAPAMYKQKLETNIQIKAKACLADMACQKLNSWLSVEGKMIRKQWFNSKKNLLPPKENNYRGILSFFLSGKITAKLEEIYIDQYKLLEGFILLQFN